ncbi:unnamed protein product [Meganyctiphanes norvegica]|uniref:Chitin-binding type-2 domain-containing protein n=1 Tax=Meganyctiphanes norvegica TaxID=48144 RepID=A0AAV2RF05_MEGNR
MRRNSVKLLEVFVVTAAVVAAAATASAASDTASEKVADVGGLLPINKNDILKDYYGGFYCDWPHGQQYWPHPYNCHMFIQCSSSGPQEMICPQGTAWSQYILTCDHKHNTDCYQYGKRADAVVKYDILPDQDLNAAEHLPVNNNDLLKYHYVPWPQCNWPFGQKYWEHPYDCTMYVKCTPFGPQEMYCPYGTAWSQYYLTCDHYYNTYCGYYGKRDGDVGVGSGDEDTPCSTPSHQLYWPHPDHCRMYLRCTADGPQAMFCAQGMAWSTSMLTCDNETNTDCAGESSKTMSYTTSTMAPNTYESSLEDTESSKSMAQTTSTMAPNTFESSSGDTEFPSWTLTTST